MLKKRIPTIVGLFLLLVGVMGGVVFINQETNFLPRAAPEYAPQKVKITNITDTGFVVSWITEEPSLGFIKYSDNLLSLSTTAVDDRDQLSGSSGEYRTHYVSLQNLNPSSTYYFKLGSQKDQLYDNNGQPFSITLPNIIDNKPAADTIFGTVLTAVDTPAEGAIIYLSIENATPLSSLVKQNGNWATNLSMARSTDLSAYAQYDPVNAQINMLIQSNDGEPTTAVTTTNNDQPVPTIVLGKPNVFVNESTPTPTPTVTPAATPVPSSMPNSTPPSTSSSKFNLAPLTAGDNNTITITTIPANGIIDSTQPEFEGKAPPNTTLIITVHSPVAHTASVTSSDKGIWQWLVPKPLEQGEHIIAITYTGSDGQIYSTQKSFVIGGVSLQQVDLAYAATPSATPQPTPKPSPTPTSTTTPSPTPIPTPTPRAIVTASGSADIIAGDTSAGTGVIILGLLFIAAGIISRKLLPSR